MGSIERFLRGRGFLCITGHHRDQLASLESYALEFLRCGVEGMITVDVSLPYEAPLPMVAVKIPESPFVGLYEGPDSTAFRQFAEQLGESAAETLLAQIEHSEPIGRLTVEGVGIRGVGISRI
jgi:DNA-binding LacI/PurR family transcriptional regulator